MKISQEIRDLAKELLERYKKEIEDTGHKASGNLQNSASYKCTFDGKSLEVWFNIPEYWLYLENGTKPHFPPIKAIEEWITVKRIIPSPSTVNGKVPSTRSLAFVIARSISLKGTQPTKLLQKTIDSADDLIEAILDVLASQLQEQINEEILI